MQDLENQLGMLRTVECFFFLPFNGARERITFRSPYHYISVSINRA